MYTPSIDNKRPLKKAYSKRKRVEEQFTNVSTTNGQFERQMTDNILIEEALR